MRISGGRAARLPLTIPKDVEIRPTQDRIRQVIFSSLAARVPETHILDLFAGTGAIGIEALSRGAASAVFVESNAECCTCIQQNLLTLRLESESAHVQQQDVLAFLQDPVWASKTFDLIFADPPYEKKKMSLDDHPLLGAVRPHLKPDGLFVWEHFSGQTLISPAGWNIERHRNYGETGLTFLTLA